MSISAADLAGLSGMYDSAGELQAKQIANNYKLGTAQIKGSYKIAQLESKDRRAAIEAETLQNRERIAQARAEMEQVGIPQMLINKFVAEKNAEIAQEDMALKKEVAAQDYGIKVGDITGVFNGAPTEAAKEFAAKMGIDEGTLTGMYNGMPTLEKQKFEEQARQFSQTYGLDVAKFKAQLASTPDTYFQSQQFNANDLPRLMGMTGGGPGQVGTPTPGISTMGDTLRYAQGQGQGQGQGAGAGANMEIGYMSPEQYAASSAGTPYGGLDVNLTGTPPTPGAAGGGGTSMRPSYLQPEQYAQFDALPDAVKRQYLMADQAGQGDASAADDRAKQIAQVAKASPPSPFDGLSDQDASSLRLMQSIYQKGFQGLPRGELERLQASGRMGFLKSAGNLLGYSPDQAIAQYNQYSPTQGSASLA